MRNNSINIDETLTRQELLSQMEMTDREIDATVLNHLSLYGSALRNLGKAYARCSLATTEEESIFCQQEMLKIFEWFSGKMSIVGSIGVLLALDKMDKIHGTKYITNDGEGIIDYVKLSADANTAVKKLVKNVNSKQNQMEV